MKSKHLKKETVKRLDMGFHTDLMEIFEESVDLYIEKTFDRGYQSFFDDAPVLSYRLAKYIVKKTTYAGIKLPDTAIVILSTVIEEYFNSLKHE